MDLSIVFLIVSLQFQLPYGLLSSICFVESKHNPSAIHRDDGKGNSIGLCQIKLKTAMDLGFKGTEKDLLDPVINAYYAGAYLRHQLDRYHGAVNKAVIAYNIGHAGKLTYTTYQYKVYNKWGYDVSSEK